jgi:hypothetical protein
MKKLFVMTAVSVAILSSGSVMAWGVTPAAPIAAAPAGAMALTSPASALSMNANNGSSVGGIGTSGQVANQMVSATSGASTFSSDLSQTGAKTSQSSILGIVGTGTTDSGVSTLTVGQTMNGTNVSLSSTNVANQGAGGTTTQGMSNGGTVMSGAVASALPSANNLPQVSVDE